MLDKRHPYQDFENELEVVTRLQDSGCVNVTFCSGALLFQMVSESRASVHLYGDGRECEWLAMISPTTVQATSESKQDWIPWPGRQARHRTQQS